MTIRHPSTLRSAQTGVSLLEALIGILIFSIGILGLMGLQAASIRNTVESKYRNEASYLANRVVGTMWSDITNLATYDTSGALNSNATAWRTTVASTLPGVVAGGTNSPTIAISGNQATITVFWQMPGSGAPVRQLRIIAQIRPD